MANAPAANVPAPNVPAGDVLEGARARSRALLAGSRLGEARQVALTALDTYGPDAELSLVLALAYAAEDDDEDDRVYREALVVADGRVFGGSGVQ
ncbi:hypothetical protein ACIA8F_35000 [Streptomyces sp. NPDC051563]|uniref:hypothetical protein n=1 Tax=Streptomyces sp. NPDC051563 TaxID=3365659 RepID=UPI00379B91CB